MTNIKRLALTAALTLFLTQMISAQRPRINSINITAEPDKLRVAAQGDVSEMSLKVANKAGDVIFESVSATGSLLDWNMTDAQGERVTPGTYIASVTFRNAAGKLRKMVEQVVVAEGEEQSSVPAAKAAPSAPEETQAAVTTSGSILRNRIPLFDSPSSIAMATVVEDAGNIGLNMVPRTGWRLDVLGPALFRTGGRGGPNNTGEIKLGTPNGDTGITIMGSNLNNTNRADLRFDGSTLRLLAGAGSGPPPVTNGINISTAGNVGIGAEPSTAARVLLRGGMLAYATQAAAAVQGTAVTTATGLSGRSFQGAGVIGETNAGGYGVAGVLGTNTAGGWAMYAAGHTGQNDANFGWVKALVYLSADWKIIRCFNSTLPDGGASQPLTGTEGCGFKMQPYPENTIDFNFKVSDRFVTITPQKAGKYATGINFVFSTQYSDQWLTVRPHLTNDGEAGAAEKAPAMVVVY
jgi:hypothetical protein